MTRPMFPHAIDSTILGTFRSCPQKAFRSYIEHWKPQTESVHLVAGGAFAAGIEAARRAFYETDVDQAEATAIGLQSLIERYGDFECPSDSAKSLERMCGALEFYFENYPLGLDGTKPVRFANGKWGIEFDFAEPLDVKHPVTGNPILYTGRSDAIVEFASGIYVVDEKTTSSLGASWPRQWEMRSQFTGYCWAARRIGLEPAGALVRGISILKTKYDHMQVLTGRSNYELDRWYDQTNRDIERMIQCWKDGYWDWNLDHACAEYGGCGFQRICKSANPESFLPVYYHKRVWDPLLRKEMTVEEYEASWQ